MYLTQDAAEKRLADLHMSDMPVIAIQPTPCRVAPDWFAQYKKLCHKFMESLTDSVEELAFMNLSQNEFMALISGRAMPQNTSIRFRIPLIWGGKLEIDSPIDAREHIAGGKIAVENYGRGIFYIRVVESDRAVRLDFAKAIAVENNVSLGGYHPRLVGAYRASAVIALVGTHPVVSSLGEELK